MLFSSQKLGIGLLVFALFSCGIQSSKTAGPDGKLRCMDGNGNMVDAYTLFGKWKKISGYSNDPRSSESLALNYEIYAFPHGSNVCMQAISNGALQTGNNWFGTYQHNPDTKNIFISYSSGRSGSDQAVYSFSGGCKDLEMTLTYRSGKVERFILFNKDVSEDPCAVD